MSSATFARRCRGAELKETRSPQPVIFRRVTLRYRLAKWKFPRHIQTQHRGQLLMNSASGGKTHYRKPHRFRQTGVEVIGLVSTHAWLLSWILETQSRYSSQMDRHFGRRQSPRPFSA